MFRNLYNTYQNRFFHFTWKKNNFWLNRIEWWKYNSSLSFIFAELLVTLNESVIIRKTLFPDVFFFNKYILSEGLSAVCLGTFVLFCYITYCIKMDKISWTKKVFLNINLNSFLNVSKRRSRGFFYSVYACLKTASQH